MYLSAPSLDVSERSVNLPSKRGARNTTVFEVCDFVKLMLAIVSVSLVHALSFCHRREGRETTAPEVCNFVKLMVPILLVNSSLDVSAHSLPLSSKRGPEKQKSPVCDFGYQKASPRNDGPPNLRFHEINDVNS